MVARALVIGGIVEDVRLQLATVTAKKGELRLPIGQKIVANQAHRTFGGGGFNVSVGLARLGVRTTIIAAVGNDDAGTRAIAALRAAGVKPAISTKAGGGTASRTAMSVILSFAGGDVIVGDRGANRRREWASIRPYLRPKPTLIVITHLSGRLDLVQKVVSSAARSTRIVWNPGSSELSKGLKAARGVLRQGPAVVLNEDELAAWTTVRIRSSQHRARAANDLLALGARLVVVTLGARGATAYARGADRVCAWHVPALSTRIVDRVGAGDSFIAGFASQWCKDDDVARALLAGSLNAAANLRVAGATEGLLTRAQLQAKLRRYPLVSATAPR